MNTIMQEKEIQNQRNRERREIKQDERIRSKAVPKECWEKIQRLEKQIKKVTKDHNNMKITSDIQIEILMRNSEINPYS